MGWLNPIMIALSEGIIVLGPLLAVLVYLCIDKKYGRRMLFSMCIGDFIMNNMKITACVYRPWIRDSRLHIAREISSTATGYSFPSGHTSAATTIYGSVALWQKKKKWLAAIAVVLLLITAFSRNWLGAHTIWDVLVAIVVGLVAIIICEYVGRWIEKDKKRDKWVLITVIGLCIISAIYVSVKSYPLDYLEDGTLLVDPWKMANDTWAALGLVVGWVVAWYVEKKFIDFDVNGSIGQKILRGIAAAVVFLVGYMFVFEKVAIIVGGPCGAFLKRFLTTITVLIIIPLCIRFIQDRRKK